MENNRFFGIDFIRGVFVVSMMIYHTIWDMVCIVGFQWDWFFSVPTYIWLQSIGWGFVLLSGFSWSLGSHPLKRGLQVFGMGALVTLVTMFIMPESMIFCGILTFLGSGMLLMIVLHPLLKKWNPFIGAGVFFVLFVLTRNINFGYLGFEIWDWVALPKSWYTSWFGTYLGFTRADCTSSDYYSLMPWIFLYIVGYFLYAAICKYHVMRNLVASRCKWIEWMGRHSLLLYVIHQPILLAVMLLLSQITN